MFGNCKVCIEKELRITELKEQITYFKSVLHPEPRARTYQLEQELEQDMVLDGGGKEEVDLEAEAIENERIRREQDVIFSGNTEEIN